MKYLNLGPRASAIRPQHVGACHNCHAPVSEKFCGQCGQNAHVHVASAHEFIHHFIGHYVAAEGKLWRTLLALLFRPGQLTLEFVRGRRGQFIDPLRLLLTISLVAFLVMKMTPDLVSTDEPKPAPEQASTAKPKDTSGPLQKWLISTHKSLSPTFAANYKKYLDLPAKQQADMFMNTWFTKGPTVALSLIPVIAAWLKLAHLGTGWRYGEHLVFSFHSLAYSLCLLTVGLLLSALTDLPHTWLFTIGTIPIYLLIAMRKVYGGNWGLTALRWGGVVYASLTSFKLMMLMAFSFTIAAGIT